MTERRPGLPWAEEWARAAQPKPGWRYPSPSARVWGRPDWSPRRPAMDGEPRCADCAYLRLRQGARRRYAKCMLTETRSAATDIGVRDAACARFEPREEAP